MKLKRLVIMLAFAVFIVTIPLLATSSSNDYIPDSMNRLPVIEDADYIYDGITSVGDSRDGVTVVGDGGLSIIGDMEPVLNFAVYGYGTLQAMSPMGSIISGSQIPSGTVITFTAVGIGAAGFELIGWRIDGRLYPGAISYTHTLTITDDTVVVAVFNHPWNEAATPPPSSYTQVVAVNATADAHGGVTIRIPGRTGFVEVEDFTTDTTTEFRISPPEGMYFSAATTLNLSQGITRTFGPVVLGDGRLSFTMRNLDPNNDNAEPTAYEDESEDGYEEAQFALIFEPEEGTMPSGTQIIQSVPYGHVINPLPTPTKTGYTFTGWRLNGSNMAAAPLTITTDTILTAVWAPIENGSLFAAAFNPAPGSFSDTNETGLRPGAYGTVVTNPPANPARSGYTFGGWRLPNGNILAGQLTIRSDIALTAVWNANAAASPSPSPSPSASPTPAPGSATRPNPQTSPLHISFMIFGVITLGGTAAFGIMKLTRKQIAAQGQYDMEMARYNREKRIMDLVDKE